MTTQRESKLSRKIIDSINARPKGFAFKVHGSKFMMAGLPDIIGVVDGRFIALETKMPENRDGVKPIQKHVHGLIRAAGGYCAVVSSVAEARMCIDECLSGYTQT